MNEKQSLFEVLGPGKSFTFGIIMAFLLIFSVGFFVLLFSGNDGLKIAKNTGNNVAKDFNKPAADNDIGDKPVPVQPSTQIDIKDITSDDHVRGDISTAEVVVVEFSDIDCPFCARFHPTLQQIVDDYQGKVAWVYRHFPLDSLHPDARKKAEATECVASLGGEDAFWTFLDSLYVDTADNLDALAEAVGVNVTAFNKCLDSGEFKDKVQGQYQDAVTSGGTGTPYAVAISRSGERVPIKGALPLAQVKATIDSMIK